MTRIAREVAAVVSLGIAGLGVAVVPFSTAAQTSTAVRIQAPAAIKVGIAGTNGYSVQSIEIEEYVSGVLAGEAARDSDPAVLQALAVAIRTYALRNLGRHQREGFDICDETHCQVLRRATAATVAAASQTAGQVLTYRGALATVYYSASCGGHSQVPSAVWPGAEDPPYLPARPDVGCGGDPVWNAAMRTEDIERTLRNLGYRGSLKLIKILARDATGRVTRLGLDGMRPAIIGGPELRMALGATQIKSTLFEVERTGDAHAFAGRGYGHGVGMCVIGATRLAALGETAAVLLARYYPGTVIGIIDTGSVPAMPVTSTPNGRSAPPAPRPAAPVTGGSGVNAPRPAAPVAGSTAVGGTRLSAPTGPPVVGAGSLSANDQRGDAVTPQREVEALVASAQAQLAMALELPVPGRPPVVMHPTDQAFERASGRPWYMFAALVRGEIHVMPLEQLKLRGVLERVIRREVVHALVDASLAARQQWVRDGTALFYADLNPPTADTDLRGPCPTNADLLQPVSAGALAQAYARARSCVARQMTGGRSWRDVR